MMARSSPDNLRVDFAAVVIVLFVALAIAGCGRSASESPAVLLGTWRIVDEKLDDRLILTWRFDESFVTVVDGFGNPISRNAYSVDTSHQPHHITLEIRDEHASESRPGIFEIDGNQLRISMNVSGGERPKNFESGEALVFERVEFVPPQAD